MKFNKDKCQLNLSEILFLGHMIDREGIRPDPSKDDAFSKLKEPANVSELRRFLGMINYLLKLLPNKFDQS